MHLARELMLKATVKAPFAVVRSTLIYGEGDPHNGYGPNRFRRLAAAGQEIVLFGEGEERRDHVLVDDVAEIVCRVIEHRSRGTLNIATGEVYSFRDIAERVAAMAKPGWRCAGRRGRERCRTAATDRSTSGPAAALFRISAIRRSPTA